MFLTPKDNVELINSGNQKAHTFQRNFRSTGDQTGYLQFEVGLSSSFLSSSPSSDTNFVMIEGRKSFDLPLISMLSREIL